MSLSILLSEAAPGRENWMREPVACLIVEMRCRPSPPLRRAPTSDVGMMNLNWTGDVLMKEEDVQGMVSV